MNSICVFCASSPGHDKKFREAAFSVGKFLADKKLTLVYGGAKVGLMGAVADGAIENGGKVIGVLPKFLSSKEIAHDHLTELIIVESMHERKMKMHELSDAAIALPGGFGTMEELFELLTWGQLGLHKKPIALLNISGFYDPLIQQVSLMNSQGFLNETNMNLLLHGKNMEELFETMSKWKSSASEKWIKERET
jgi:hypothetical protein